jgi:hypothetical protein
MTPPLATTPGSVAPGQITFFDAIQPPLTAGPYTLSAQQAVNVTGETVPPYQAEQPFVVDGPRFAVPQSEIHSVFPPPNQAGAWLDLLPHVVFRGASLPWMRPLQPGVPEEGTGAAPWMAVLTVYDDEGPAGASPRMTAPAAVPVAEVLSPTDPAVLPPCLPADAGNNGQPVLVTDMDLGFFQAIAPARGELPFLAHAREVHTGGKVLLGMDEDGRFSLVVGNRVAQNAGGSTALLVSLEGHQDHLAGSGAPAACGGGAPAQPYTRVRLVVLASWRFVSLATPGTFTAVMEALYDPGNGGVGLLQLPGTPDAAGDATAGTALRMGFVALPNRMRVGEQATSWYHGPLAATPTRRDTAYAPYTFSDHAMYYDPATGIFDQGYAAAWQIGRLLALSDAGFAATLFNWRRRHTAAQHAADDTQAVQGRLAASLAPPQGGGAPAVQDAQAGGARTGTAAADAAAQTPSVQLRGFMLGRLGPAAAALPRVVPRAARTRAAGLPGVLPTDHVQAITESGDEPLAAVRAHIRKGGGQ